MRGLGDPLQVDMAKLSVQYDLGETERQLAAYDGLSHLRVRARGAVLTIESGPRDDPHPHARLRRETATLWSLEMAGCSGRWEPTGLRDARAKLVQALVEQFGWVLEPIGEPGTD